MTYRYLSKSAQYKAYYVYVYYIMFMGFPINREFHK